MSDFTLRTKYLDSILTNPIYMWKIIFWNGIKPDISCIYVTKIH